MHGSMALASRETVEAALNRKRAQSQGLGWIAIRVRSSKLLLGQPFFDPVQDGRRELVIELALHGEVVRHRSGDSEHDPNGPG
jgi:hypothetical protein